IQVGGRGILVDDGGSGAWIALAALKALFRRIDAVGRPDGMEILAAAIAEAVGGDGWPPVRAYVYGGERGRIGQLAPAVARAAAG
ncbi:hypothetical protein J8J27_31715, partial [Mycobacterium tuberculosis]|nr:hypothetical protein [Mycobacterium tuberculosis]